MSFEIATRLKLRFPTSKGGASAEDLWDLPLTGGGANLDDIAKAIHKQLREADTEVSFVPTKKAAASPENRLQIMFDVVKHVIQVRVTERDAAEAATERRATKQKIMAVLARKEDAALENTSADDLRKMLDNL